MTTLNIVNNNKDLVNKYKKELKITDVLANILINRNISIKQANNMLYNNHNSILNPYLLNNAEEASDTIDKYIKDENATIIVYGDYDCDGITSTYIFVKALSYLKPKCKIEYNIPERIDGYGIGIAFAKKTIEKHKDEKVLVVTVDNGINQLEAISYLLNNSIEVVVTDHHISNGELPNCICVDPWKDNNSPYKYLAGCGVIFKVMQILLWKHNKGKELMELTPIVAIGTLADMMPLSEENIAFIQYGLKILNDPNKCPRFLQLLIYYDFYLNDKKTNYRTFKRVSFEEYYSNSLCNVSYCINANHIQWNIAPLINGCGRMGNMKLATKLFFSSDLIDLDLIHIIENIYELNENRKKLINKHIEQISKDDSAIKKSNVCIITVDLPIGMNGLLAGKISNNYNKPTIVLSKKEDNVYVGSARSIQGVDINNLLKKHKDLLISYGGHSEAAGLSLYKDNINKLFNALNEDLKEVIIEDSEQIINIDNIVSLDELNKTTYNEIQMLPYNHSFIEPIMLLKDLNILDTKQSCNNENNIKFSIKNKRKEFNIWAWGFSKKYYEELESPKKISMIGTVDRNFMNKTEYTFKVLDIVSECN